MSRIEFYLKKDEPIFHFSISWLSSEHSRHLTKSVDQQPSLSSLRERPGRWVLGGLRISQQSGGTLESEPEQLFPCCWESVKQELTGYQKHTALCTTIAHPEVPNPKNPESTFVSHLAAKPDLKWSGGSGECLFIPLTVDFLHFTARLLMGLITRASSELTGDSN